MNVAAPPENATGGLTAAPSTVIWTRPLSGTASLGRSDDTPSSKFSGTP